MPCQDHGRVDPGANRDSSDQSNNPDDDHRVDKKLDVQLLSGDSVHNRQDRSRQQDCQRHGDRCQHRRLQQELSPQLRLRRADHLPHADLAHTFGRTCRGKICVVDAGEHQDQNTDRSKHKQISCVTYSGIIIVDA